MRCLFVTLLLFARYLPAADAIQKARESLQMAEDKYGPDHPATAMMMRELALAFERSGYPNYAEQYALRSLAALEERLGANDFNLVPVLNVLAEAYAAQGRNTEALGTQMRAVAIGPAAGPHYGTALHNAAELLVRDGKLSQAEEMFGKALAAREATLPPGHPFIEATRKELQRVRKALRLPH
jgi:tetratricopeptide (TPR) repeat protein